MKKILFGVFLAIISVWASAWPTKEITIVIPYQAGGVTDQLARTMQVDLENILKVPVVIQNKPGAANMVAINHIMSKPSDDHTFLFTIDEFVSGPVFQNSTAYKNFKGVTITGVVPFLVYSTSTSNLEKFKKQLKNNTKIDIGSVGVNGGANLWISNLQPITVNSISYKGSPQLLTDVVAGHSEYGIMSMSGSYSLIQQGKLNPIMVSSSHRNTQMPHVPTFKELNLHGDSAENWFGIVTQKETSDQAVYKFSGAVRLIVANNPEVKEFTKKGMNLVNLDPVQSDKFLEKEIARFEKLYQKSK